MTKDETKHLNDAIKAYETSVVMHGRYGMVWLVNMLLRERKESQLSMRG